MSFVFPPNVGLGAVLPPRILLKAVPLRVKKQQRPRPRRSGVYFLLKEHRAIYIGESVDVHQRLAAHLAQRRAHATFDRALLWPLPPNEELLLAYESVLIHVLRPPLNRKARLRIDPSLRRQIVMELGL